jgi:hypothetical protein
MSHPDSPAPLSPRWQIMQVVTSELTDLLALMRDYSNWMSRTDAGLLKTSRALIDGRCS